MTHYIVAGQVAETDIIDLSKHLHGYIQTGYRSARQILLGLVTGNDDLGAKTDTGQEHLHLGRRGILCLIQDDVGIVEGTSPHVCQRRYLDQSLLLVMQKALRSHDLVQGIIKRPQIRVDLALQVTRQKSQLLASLNSRPG